MAETPTDPRLLDQQLQKGELELKKLAFDQQLAEYKAMIPTVPAWSNGEVDSGDAPSPIAMLGVFRALETIADEVEALCKSQNLTKVRVCSTGCVEREKQAHSVVTAAIERIGLELDSAASLLAAEIPDAVEPTDEPTDSDLELRVQGFLPLEAAAPAALPLALGASIVSSFLPSITSLLDSSSTVRSKEVTITNEDICTVVVGRLLSSDGNFEVAIDSDGIPSSFQLYRQIRRQERRVTELELRLAEYRSNSTPAGSATARQKALEIVLTERAKVEGLDVSELINDIATAAQDAANDAAHLAGHEARAGAARTLLDGVKSVISALTTAPTSGRSALELADSWSQTKQHATLALSSLFAGAESIYEEIPARKDRGLHVGSAAVSYRLKSPDGALLATGVFYGQSAGISKMGEAAIDWQ